MKKEIEILGARQNNLKNITLKIPKETLCVVTGPSGSGKSSLAFDTLFAEGQRRYMESLSTYVRQFLERQEKPDVDAIHGLCPTIAIEQKNQTKNSRSTVGTATEIYDYLRLLFAKLGTMYCLKTGEPVKKDIVSEVVQRLLTDYAGMRAYIGFPIDFTAKSKIQDRKQLAASFLERGYSRVGVAKKVFEIEEELPKKTSPVWGKSGQTQNVVVHLDRLVLDEESRSRLSDAISNSYQEGFGRAVVWIWDEQDRLIREANYCEFPSAGGGAIRYPDLTPVLFSFNSPIGACVSCKGFGNQLVLDPALVIPRPELTLAQGCVEPLTRPSLKNHFKKMLLFCSKEKISPHLPWERLKEADRKKLWEGSGDFPGLVGIFEQFEADRYKVQVRVLLSRYKSPRICPACQGHRLRPEARNVLLHGKSIGDLTALSIEELQKWFAETPFTKTERLMGKDLLPQIEARLDFLMRVGLDYLSLSRLAKTLSGGEAQRIALANQLGSRLTQTCYVLDEPSIGLHPKDSQRLIEIIRALVKLRNSVVVVEHDPEMILAAEHIVELGPESGRGGGELLFSGSREEFLKADVPTSKTLAFLRGTQEIPVPKRRRLDRIEDTGRKVDWLELKGLKENNLQNIDLRIPLQCFVGISGVSGSGKSSAIRKTLYPALAKIFLQENEDVGVFSRIEGFDKIKNVQLIDQAPIGRSARSNPITYLKAYDDIRELMASSPLARRRNYHPGFFSFNVPGGRCEQCEGEGFTRVEMLFMEDVFLKCDACEGTRFKKEILEVTHQGLNIHQILNLTAEEAKKLFSNERRLPKVLKILCDVGLGYLTIGQSSTTLSGGESQRLKIARELAFSEAVNTVYVLDEPTTGLHLADVKVLIRVLHELVERGNSVICIEHHLDVLKTADWIIDFGPGGGKHGGRIVAQGTPESIVTQKESVTGEFLVKNLEQSTKLPVDQWLRMS